MSADKYKLFFITTNLVFEDNKIKISSNTRGLENLTKITQEKYDDLKYKDEDFYKKIYCLDIIPGNLRSKENGVNKGEIVLTNENKSGKLNKFNFTFFFNGHDYNFLYNLNFKEYKSFGKNYIPPRSAVLSYLTQLLDYKAIITKTYKSSKESLLKALFNDSFSIIEKKTEKEYDFDFYLELFKLRYNNGEILKLIDAFNLKKIKLSSDKQAIKKYSKSLKMIEGRIEKEEIFKNIDEENKNRYKINFYTLLLYFHSNYDTENLENFLLKKNIWKILINILQENTIFFYNINIPKDLIDEMFNQTQFHFQKLEYIFNYINSLETALMYINANIDKIYNCCLDKNRDKIKNKFDLSKFNIVPKDTDNYSKIYVELSNLIKYEKSHKHFIIISEALWDLFIHKNYLRNLNNLEIIDKSLSICKEVDKSLTLSIHKEISETFTYAINQGLLKNNELLKYIKKNAYFQSNKKFENLIYRPLEIFNGFDFNDINEEFFKLWKDVDLIKIYSFLQNQPIQLIIGKISHMKDFSILLRLFNFPNISSNDKVIVVFLRAKFIKLINTYTKESCPNFINATSLLIYGLDKCGINFIQFLDDKILNNFPREISNEIFLNITKNYQDISKDLIKYVINYFINAKNNPKIETIISLLKTAPNINFLKLIFYEINIYTIKEEELFNEKRDIKSFQLLDWIQKEKLIDKYSELKETVYVEKTNKTKIKILGNIKSGNIRYDMISDWYINNNNINIFKEKLQIILFHKDEDFKKCIDCMNQNIYKIKSLIKDINKLISVLKEFYENKHKEDIKFLNEFMDRIKSGFLNEIEKEKTKADLIKMDKILPDLNEKNDLKNSLFFMNLYKKHRTNKKNQFFEDDKIFELTKNDFEKLNLFFKNNWSHNIEDPIKKNCYDAIKSLEKNDVNKEIILLKKIFKVENIDIEPITDNLIALSKTEKIFLTLKGFLNFIEETKAKQTEFSKELRKFQDILAQNVTAEKLTSFGKELEKYGIYVLGKEDNQDYLNIIHSLYRKKGSLEFLLKLSSDDCHYLQELCSETENTLLTIADIQDMEKCCKYMKNIIGNNSKTDLEIITLFREKIKEQKNISVVFEQYANNSRDIQELFSQKLDISKASLKTIKFILKDSEFSLSIYNESENYFKFEGKYTDEEKEEKEISYEELIELRRRAMLTKKLGEEKSDEEKNIFMFNKIFAQKINEILKINNILKKIAEKGYSENIKLTILLKDSNSAFFAIEENVKFKDYEQCIKYFNKIYSDINKIQNDFYKNEQTKLIRYIHGRLFILFRNYFLNYPNENIDPLLKYITNDLTESNFDIREDYHYQYEHNLDDKKYVCLLKNINKFLAEYLSKNSLTLENIFQQNIVKKEFNGEFKGLYTYLLQDDGCTFQRGEEEHILNWYYFLTANAPMAQSVLLCNEETTSEEIIAFLYRAFLCEFNAVFMVGRLNLLTPEKRQIITGLINMLYIGHEKEMKSCLVFVYSDKNLTIIQYFQRILAKKLEHKNKKKNEKYLFNEKVQIICSDKAGVGKSTHIIEDIKKSKKRYIHFPFGGEISRKEIISRLKRIKIKNKDASETVIHLDLYDSKQTDLMKNFLFCFLITKLYSQNENLFYLSKNVEIKIEIPNGFIEFLYKFPLLDMFENKHKMSITKLENLIVEPNLNSNIQIVCNYLKLFEDEKINDVELYIKNISIEKDEFDINVEERNATSMSQKECQRLIYKYIGIDNPTYYQITSFINVLAGQLKKFSMNYQLTVRYLTENGELMNENLKGIRKILVDGFIKNTQHFTKGAYNNLLNSKEENYKVQAVGGIYDVAEQEKVAIDVLSIQDKEMIEFSKIDPSLIFFHENQGQEFSIISASEPKDEEYKNLLKLVRVPALIKREFNKNNGNDEKVEIPEKLKDYRNFTHEDFLKELKEILNIENPVLNRDKTEQTNDKDLKSIEEIVGEYVFTADNFIKMILILLRIRENIPTIMMGETGCGKTSLIRKLSELLNNGKSNMKILNIHAGIKDKEIVEFLKKKENQNKQTILEEAKQLYITERRKKEESMKKDFKYFEKKLWIFLDEINTCNCMGLISELMTKHSCQGEKLPESIVFIAACNPYRKLYNEEAINGLELKGAQKRILAYTVNPLPFSLLNFIFNFGRLTTEDEERYIKNMIINPIERFYIEDIKKSEKNKKIRFENNDTRKSIIDFFDNKKELIDQYNKLKEIAKASIIKAQIYVRSKYGDSSVSLREIRRFSIFYEFFVNYLRKKRNLFQDMEINEFSDMRDIFYKNLKDYDIYKYSINLSVYICYYLRLTNKNYREEFTLEMNKIFGFDFEEIPKREEKYIVDNIEMKEGIAKNRALLENIFSLFVCINAKVPLFIVGKPGCSKSLSVQLLYKSMKGEEYSDNKLFNNLPKLMLTPFQGSLSSTSEGVQKVFKIARKNLENKNKTKEEIISMIYFDEMGLAEHSINNPLKVIHSELEYDLNEGSKKIAFVGISNWILDASKMNRGIYLSINPPDLKDLIETSETIAKTYDDTLASKNKEFFSNLANTYFNYKEELKTNHTKFEDYHGSRDFYHLIKNSMISLLIKAKKERNTQLDEQIKQTTGIDSLERNFGGLELNQDLTSLMLIKKEFKKKYEKINIQKKYNVLQRIEENLSDKQSRYLLLISKSSVSNYLLKNILSDKKINKDSSFYIGSRFIKDQQSEEYTLKILNKIQIQMEQDKVLLLTDLESVYPSLYDLFNQNFTVMGKKNYARIAVGGSNSTISLVNDGFKCIILVDQNSIGKEEPPFLNRFEKHIISFEYLLPKKIGDDAKAIYNLIQDFVKMKIEIAGDDNKNNNYKLLYDIEELLVNCDEEEIQGIIYSKYKEYENKGEEIIMENLQDYVLEKIALTLPEDIILYMHFSGFNQKYNNALKKILEFYNRGEHSNLANFLKTMKNIKNVIYTFTNIDEPLLPNYVPEISKSKSDKMKSTNAIGIDTLMFGKINAYNITDILISQLSSENQLEEELEKFYLDNEKKIFVLKFNPEETDLMNYTKFFIENYIKEKNYFDENKNNKKAFIFTIHMNRIFDSVKLDKQKNKKFLDRNKMGETISHLSDFYQIFIDNLSGDNISLVDIINNNLEDLFKKFLNFEDEFNKNIYEVFSYFNYEFIINIPEINQSKYSKNLIEYLLYEKDLKNKIINCITRQNKKEKSENIFFDIIKNNLVKLEDVDMISIIRKYLSNLFKNNFAKFIFKSEKEHFLSPLFLNNLQNFLFQNINAKYTKKENKRDNNIIEKEINEIKIENNGNDKEGNIEKIDKRDLEDFSQNKLIKLLESNYLDKLDISETKDFNTNMKKNQIELLIGLKLPGIIDIINKIRLYMKTNVCQKYLKIEQDIRELDEESFYRIEGRIRNALNRCVKNVETEIINHESIQNLEKISKENIDDYNQFYELLLDDYFLIFLREIIPDIKNCYSNLKDFINILKKMINIRLENELQMEPNEQTNQIELFSKKVLWVESYSQYISIILNTYQKILPFEKDLFNKMDKIIENKNIQYEISGRSPKHIEKYNLPFFYILESLLQVINSDFEIYEKNEKQKFIDFIILLKLIFENISKIFNELFIHSNEIISLNEFLNIQKHLNSVNKSNKENLLEIIRILSEHTRLANIVNNNEDKLQCDDLCENMNKFYEFLYKNLGDSDNFAKLMINICTEEIKIKNFHYRKKLVEIILKSPKMIQNSYQFMSIIINKFIETDLELITKNIENLKNLHTDINYLEVINENESDGLNEILLNIFENNFNLFFESIVNFDLENEKNKKYFKKFFPKYINQIDESGKKNPTFIMFDTTLDIFKNCLNTLEFIYRNSLEEEEHKQKINNELIIKLYCIAFIKIYLFKCIHFADSKNEEFSGFIEIMNIIKGNSNNNFRKMIKIYIFKIIFHIMNRDFEKFKDYHYQQHEINFVDEFKDYFSSKKKTSLNYYLLPIESYEDYQSIERKFEDYKYNHFGDGVKEFRDYIETNGIDDFYTISSNIIVSNLSIPNYTNDEAYYSEYSSFVKNLFDNNLKISKIKKQLFFLFSNEAEFSNKIKPKILTKEKEKVDPNIFEMLLYSMRICLQISDSEKSIEYFYAHIISPEITKIFEENCIPGNNLLDNIYVNNYKQVEEHLKTQDHDVGAYVCSCGLYYEIPPCGFPKSKDPEEEENEEDEFINKCLNCNLPIGHAPPKEGYTGTHSMVIREGHLRIFKDEEHRIQEFNEYGDYDEGIPNMLLIDYKKKVIDPILEKAKFGLNKVNKKYFEQTNITIRNLSIIGYRLLNYIIYSNIFFAHCLGFISDEILKSYVSDGMTIIEMIETDWNILKDCLQTKGVQTIQVFMNMIFKKLCTLLMNCKVMKTSEDREKFEEEIEKMLEEEYKKYDDYQKKYMEINNNSLRMDKNSMNSLVLEINNENDYNYKIFPFYKLLLMTTYPSLENFKHELIKMPNYEQKYPLLYYSLIVDDIQENVAEKNQKELLIYLPDFNEFVNFMIDNYSYKISRDDASKLILKEEDIYKNNQRGFKDMFQKFIQIWEKIKIYATKYKCNPDMDVNTLNEDKSLDYFLNDNAVIGKGMYIASAYQNFISWQNNFLNKLIDSLKNGGILHHYVDNIKKTIDVQNAKKNDVLNFKEMKEKLNRIIYDNSKRNIFKTENKISYQNYRQFIYDFDSVEKELGKELLTGKVKFNSENNLKFVTYCFEGFRGNKSSVFIDFINLYKTIDLSQETKQKIYNKKKDLIKTKSIDLQKILFSIQLLIYYLTQDTKNDKDDINLIIKELPTYVHLTDECIKFFEEQNFIVCELTAIYSFFELLCFKTIENNLNQDYKKPIDEKIQLDILKYFEDGSIKYINKVSLSSACRKLISRYLVSSRHDTDLNENNILSDYLEREELWSKEDWKKFDLIQEDLVILKTSKILVGQCYELYKLLGGDENEALKGIESNANDDEEDENEEEDYNENINFRRKKMIY